MSSAPEDLNTWIARLFEHPDLQTMGHNQRAKDKNLGLGWIYYGLARLLHTRTAVVIGSYRGFVPLVVAKALQDNAEDGEVIFVDPSMVDEFWRDPGVVRAYFESFGLERIRHFLMTTQEFVETEEYRSLDSVGLLFVDGYHTEEQARFDYQAFEALLAPRGVVLFHDSMLESESSIYGPERSYRRTVKAYIDQLKRDPSLQLFDLPFGTGLTLLRKLDEHASKPLNEGLEWRR
ncbi:MAG: class I SAM-dependent methyltransferase [Gammaproteobacteria bacterium]|nr:class I SAM-dependent methyltransferase [Gammaproteobacteria bacterium]